MKGKRGVVVVLLVVAVLAVGLAPARAFAWQEPKGVTEQIYAMSGQVAEIDRVGRMITLTAGGVVQAPIYVGPDMPIFADLNRGDLVSIRYYDAYIVEVTPRARMVPFEDTTAEAQRQLDRPDARVLQQARLVVTIDALDAATGLVTYHGVDNRRVQRLVQDRRLIEGLKVGDVVTITFTRASAVSIEKQR
jgi:hypothetical protein